MSIKEPEGLAFAAFYLGAAVVAHLHNIDDFDTSELIDVLAAVRDGRLTLFPSPAEIVDRGVRSALEQKITDHLQDERDVVRLVIRGIPDL